MTADSPIWGRSFQRLTIRAIEWITETLPRHGEPLLFLNEPCCTGRDKRRFSSPFAGDAVLLLDQSPR